MGEDDFRWIWAAYRMGGLKDLLEGGLERDEFLDQVVGLLSRFDEAYLLSLDRPVGVATVLTEPTLYRIEPHVTWFPWASMRDRLAAAVKFLNEMRDYRLAIIYAEGADQRLMEFIKRYGVLRKVGTMKDFFAPGRDAAFYQSMRSRN